MTKMIIKMTRSNSPSNYVVRSSDGSNIFTDLKISHVEQVDVIKRLIGKYPDQMYFATTAAGD